MKEMTEQMVDPQCFITNIIIIKTTIKTINNHNKIYITTLKKISKFEELKIGKDKHKNKE